MLCLVGPTEEQPKEKNVSEKIKVPSSSSESEKYLRENEQNLQTENEELAVPLTREIAEALLDNSQRETDLV